MPRYIIHKEGVYNLYSTVVDAPCYVHGLTLDQLKIAIEDERSQKGLDDLPERLERAHATGCSSFLETLEECIVTNRAGENETELSYEEFVNRFLTIPNH